MEKPAPSGGASSFSNSSPRWERSGNPGSAFNGLSRPGRGRGRGGFRGGRGGGRGGNPSKDPRPDEPHPVPSKPEPSQKPVNAEPKPSAPSSISTPVPPPEKSATTGPSVKPSKPPPRRGSRAVPPPVDTQIRTPEATSSSTSPYPSKSPSRRRRSQIGRGSAIIPPKINPPAPNDNLLRPNKPRLGPVPHTAPIKDTPPHLNQKIDMRNDIDALVERVRAVAMDNRPTTPGSHIDWAGDDDDSLPDLDDWGVTSVNNGSKVDVVSPIIVGTLRSLPDMPAHSIPGSPLKQVENIVPAPTEIPPIPQTQSQGSNTSPIAQAPTNPSIENDSEKNRPLVPDPPGNIINKKPLHPSLPAKPTAASSSAPLKTRPGATPMRNPPYPKSSAHTPKDYSGGKGSNTSHDNDASEITMEKYTDLVSEPSNVEKESPKSPEVVNPPASDIPASVVTENPQQIDEPSENNALEKKPSLEGLAASMHAPKAMADSVSAPADISSYIHPSSDSLHSDSLHGFTSTSTHTRSHTVGRPPSFQKHGHGDYGPRSARSGHSTPRGGNGRNHESYHTRTHSSPPAGAIAAQLRTHPSTRPVITGDAISRLARTIGKTGGSSSKSQPIGPPVGN